MKQVELAKQLGVSKAYMSMIMNGKKKPSKNVSLQLKRLEVNFEVDSEARNRILSHARLPIPTLPPKSHTSYNLPHSESCSIICHLPLPLQENKA